ncbi:SRPBCC family protein [Alicyclobacillus vulcanalis]|uniref:Uncharacterized conserved protein YndB, AHSA1/START domain n=1 Tax=Alicyclobacillus vulcanalis TaxID=252246 RepID=A0A1N7JYR7_9BACL|nr:SRPBCC domain-containing protein [Alicyclobacillus vulcanalis]SIS54406.1 Uncharacterized conserved protein YndB, AHSA1/START domain [Alicyclobacillus vulcanalis]
MSKLPDIVLHVDIEAPAETIWPYVSTGEGLGAWLMPSTLQPKEGEPFVLHAGPYGDSPCRVSAVLPPTRLSFHWDAHWLVEFTLQPSDGGMTRVTLRHGGWDDQHVSHTGQSHAVIRQVMENGWRRKLTEDLPRAVLGSSGA